MSSTNCSSSSAALGWWLARRATFATKGGIGALCEPVCAPDERFIEGEFFAEYLFDPMTRRNADTTDPQMIRWRLYTTRVID